jgi:GNAT superfamily N-acetyltransferase
MSAVAVRSRVMTRVARLDDLAAVLSLVRQHRADAHAEDVLSGSTRRGAAASGFRRLLEDDGHRVVVAVLPGSPAPGPGDSGEVVVGLAVLGLDPLSLVLGNPQVTAHTFVVHHEHRRCGTGVALLDAAAAFARQSGADHLVVAVGGHEAERQRFFARMGFAPLTTRRIVPVESLTRSLSAWQRNGLLVPAPRPDGATRRPRALAMLRSAAMPELTR